VTWQPISVPPKETFIFDFEEQDDFDPGHFHRMFGENGKLWPRLVIEAYVHDELSEYFHVGFSCSVKNAENIPWVTEETPVSLRDSVVDLVAEMSAYLQKTYR